MITLTSQEAQRLSSFFLHKLSEDFIDKGNAINQQFLVLALGVLRRGGDPRAAALALTHLETACHYAIKALVLPDEIQLPEDVEVQE